MAREKYNWVIEKHFGDISFSWTKEVDLYNFTYHWLVELKDSRVVHIWYSEVTSDFGFYTPFYDGITEDAEMAFLDKLRDNADYYLQWFHFYEYAKRHIPEAVNFAETKVMMTVRFNKKSFEERFWASFEGLSDSEKTDYWEWLDKNFKYRGK